ncbi:septum formation protein Maf [Desulfobacter hydrogenophilus]|uniref:dTTP/UTP pyrophosphatase n=1 Tax=Desulfobacter hydrogenophilus TaxID=2291 RepID=A0A328F6L5_9BACT|nr:Maf family protein [Desulfobacter hydrogenophilus]NDY74233.1 septum formation protein Maf [Desulfobacter hydrogenophilus]QBH14437.1 septum formation protein Maf [Desulfobacter hydrogenophilus]RAM00204.1 septum formation protein Maf [Desulfobacter hydrogenophilus]
MKTINKENIILASGSPRRKELMIQAGIDFKIHVADIDESKVDPGMAPENYVGLLSKTKAQAVAVNYPDAWTIGADTIVAVDDTILGKPTGHRQAVAMLSRLSNREHNVFTAFTITRPDADDVVTRFVNTRVRFKALSNDEINWYADTKEPYDKAGGYGIQGIGAFLVKEISGSYTNVVGLPVCELIDALMYLGAISFKEEK